MAKLKGCINKSCIANKEKTNFKETDDYCPKCGNELKCVCKKCHTQLSDDSEKYCLRCLAKKQDQKENAFKTISGLGGAALAVGALVISRGKNVVKVISKLK